MGKKKAVKRSTKQKVGEEGKVKSNEFVEESEDEGIGGPAGGLEQAAEEFELDAEMLGNAEADAEDDGLDDLFNEPSGGVAEQEFQEESGMQEDQTEGVGGTEGMLFYFVVCLALRAGFYETITAHSPAGSAIMAVKSRPQFHPRDNHRPRENLGCHLIADHAGTWAVIVSRFHIPNCAL